MAGPLILERYEILRPLGEGGMGKVYLAREQGQGREVVVKVMHEHLASEARFRQNFIRETRLLAGFRHPHAVAYYDASLDDPRQLYLVMEYVRGVSLRTLIEERGPMPPPRVGRLLGQLCSVLQAAHECGILHRDLTADNLMIVDAGKPNEALKVMDFGLARADAGGPYFALGKLSESGSSIGGGTPDYVSPEQVRGETVDERSDLYSVGVVLFRMLTGRLTFEHAQGTEQILRAHTDEKPPSFAAVGMTDVPAAIEAVVQECLAKFPEQRPQSARELGRRFEQALGQKIMLDDKIAKSAVLARPPKLPAQAEAVADTIDAWMPESIAVVKLRGFVSDMGGEVIDSSKNKKPVARPTG